MKKETFVAMFNGREKQNFKLYTDIAVGMGINGVDYMVFQGAWFYGKEDSKYVCDHYEYTHIKGVFDDGVVLECNIHHKDYWKSGYFTRFIPFENIVMVEFLEDGNTPWKGKYPQELPYKNNLNKYGEE